MWHELWHVSISALLFRDKSVFVHPVVVNEFSNIVSNIVWAKENASLTSSNLVFLDVFHACSKCSSRGSTAQEALFLDESSSIIEGVFITNLHPFIDERSVEDSWNEIVTNTLNLVSIFRSWGVQGFWFGKD